MPSERFELSIEFAGMCLFVHDPRSKKMHVLMPPVTGHLARIFYDPRDKNPKAGGDLRHARLDGVGQDLSGLKTGNSLDATVDREIVDLTTFLEGKKVPRALLDDPTPEDPVLARVTFNDGALDPRTLNPGKRWKLGRLRQKMAISASWKIPDVEMEPLVIKTRDGDLELRPHARNRKMKLFIFNAPDTERPGSGTLAANVKKVEHFRAYYRIMGVRDLMDLDVPEDDGSELRGRGRVVPPPFGRRLTCIMAQAVAEPTG